MNAHARLTLLLAILIPCFIVSFSQENRSALEPPTSTSPDGSNLDEWKEFSSPEGGFKVLFPKTPKESTGTVNVGKLIVKTHTYSVQDEDIYAVMYFDVPHVVDDPKVNGDLLLGIRNFVLAELKGKLLNDNPIFLDNNAGRLLEISLPKGGIARAIIIVAGHRLYRITAVPTKRVTPEREASAKIISSRYLESFKLTPINLSAEGEVDRYLRENPELAQRAFTADSKTGSGRMLNGKALSLPFPEYPQIAIGIHVAGTVIVKVIIDEEGKVIAAQAEGGHPFLQPNAVKAARKARFSPTLEEGKPVKVYGKITYKFVARLI
jgi:TonB family protein